MLLGIKSFHALLTQWFTTTVIKHMIFDWLCNNQHYPLKCFTAPAIQDHEDCHSYEVEYCDSHENYAFAGIVE